MDIPSSEKLLDPLDEKFNLCIEDVQIDVFVSKDESEALKDHKYLFLLSRSSLSKQTITSEIELALNFLQYLLEKSGASSVTRSFLEGFENRFLLKLEIHSLLHTLSIDSLSRNRLLSTYYTAVSLTTLHSRVIAPSALFSAAQTGNIILYAVFGGQGTANSTCVKELIDLYSTYTPFLKDLINVCGQLLNRLSRLPETREYYHGRYLNLQTWIDHPEQVPGSDFICGATVSCPMIGLLSLAHYCVTCKVLGMRPGDLRTLLHGATGHSQGIVIASVVALSDSWESFYSATLIAVESLFWIGFESNKGSPKSSLSPSVIQESVSHGSGEPSCMLSVVGLEKYHLDRALGTVKNSLPSTRQVGIAVSNTKENFVIGGPAESLAIFDSYLRSIKADPTVDQNRVPHSQRKPTVQHQFLPITVPFHTEYLSIPAQRIKDRLSSLIIFPEMLKIPVHDNRDGSDLRGLPNGTNVLYTLIDSICSDHCDWMTAFQSPHASHILTFGSGGIADLVMRLADGRGKRVISGSDFGNRDSEIGSKLDLFSPVLLPTSARMDSWAEKFQPRLVQATSGDIRLETQLSKLLGVPPVFVAGMTPTTVHWDFASAVMNAGYHIELAGGGYHDAREMSTAIQKVKNSVPAGRGISCNLIYSSPHAMAWQIPMLRRLAKEGSPIDGLTIGAGVPSLDIITEYITTLGLRHLSFKPGSISAIREVIEAAKTHPHFPIILQWTGGRGGGHHSYEDFYAPIIRTYSSIRKCQNLILVAGSGFGSYEDSYPYLSGSWSTQFGYPRMHHRWGDWSLWAKRKKERIFIAQVSLLHRFKQLMPF